MIPRPPTPPLLPYTTLFRSGPAPPPARPYPAPRPAPAPFSPSTRWRALASHRSEEHTSELQSHHDLVCRLLLEKKKSVNSFGVTFFAPSITLAGKVRLVMSW